MVDCEQFPGLKSHMQSDSKIMQKIEKCTRNDGSPLAKSTVHALGEERDCLHLCQFNTTRFYKTFTCKFMEMQLMKMSWFFL